MCQHALALPASILKKQAANNTFLAHLEQRAVTFVFSLAKPVKQHSVEVDCTFTRDKYEMADKPKSAMNFDQFGVHKPKFVNCFSLNGSEPFKPCFEHSTVFQGEHKAEFKWLRAFGLL